MKLHNEKRRRRRREEGHTHEGRGKDETSDYTKQARGLTVICIAHRFPFMVMVCVNAHSW